MLPVAAVTLIPRKTVISNGVIRCQSLSTTALSARYTEGDTCNYKPKGLANYLKTLILEDRSSPSGKETLRNFYLSS